MLVMPSLPLDRGRDRSHRHALMPSGGRAIKANGSAAMIRKHTKFQSPYLPTPTGVLTPRHVSSELIIMLFRPEWHNAICIYYT